MGATGAVGDAPAAQTADIDFVVSSMFWLMKLGDASSYLSYSVCLEPKGLYAVLLVKNLGPELRVLRQLLERT